MLRGRKFPCLISILGSTSIALQLKTGGGAPWRLRPGTWQVKSSRYSPNFIEQAAYCDHKPRVAWVYVRLLLHRRSSGTTRKSSEDSVALSWDLASPFRT